MPRSKTVTHSKTRTRKKEALEGKLKAELQEMADELGIDVKGTGHRGTVLKSDLVRDLSTD